VKRPVVEPVGAQRVEVRRAHFVLPAREFHGELAERAVDGTQASHPEIAHHRVDVGIPLRRVLEVPGDLGPEVVGVGLGSIVTVIRRRDHGRQ